MKKILVFTIAICIHAFVIAQEAEKPSAEILLKELSEKSCECVDTIKVNKKSQEEIAEEVSKCIDEQTGAYQLGSKLFSIADLNDIEDENTEPKNINISIDPNKDSPEYKKYYYELERYMMENCSSLKRKIATLDKESSTSGSENKKAIDLYNQGSEESLKGNHEEAIGYFERAVKEDPEFAFAWDNLGISYRKLNKFDEAISAYETSLKIDPNGLMPLQNIAVAYQYKEEYDKAIKAYEKLAEVDSNNPEVYYGLGHLYTNYLKDYDKGLNNMCKAYTLYIANKSPYRTDAEKVINIIYGEMKKLGEEDKFHKILMDNKITPNEQK